MENSAPSFLKIESPPQTLREMATDRLRTAIIGGHFASGTRLIERTLCDQLGVSRSIIREAIRYLEAEGLVEVEPRSGPRVATLSWEHARQIYDLRRLLEAKVAADCAEKIDDAGKAVLSKAFQNLEAAYSTPDGWTLIAATSRFYEVIFLLSGNDVCWEVVQRLNGRISRLRAMTLTSKDRAVSGSTRMARIAMAILANDPEAAARAVRDHIDEAAAIAIRLLQRDA